MPEQIHSVMPSTQYKDEHPINTVTKIKQILKDHAIDVELTWNHSGVPYCHSCQVRVIGTTFSVNGKGLTEEYAEASGYGELMERLQIGLIGGVETQKTGLQLDPAERPMKMDARLLLQQNPQWYEALSQHLYQFFGVRMRPEEIILQYADKEGKVSVSPCYNLAKNQTEYYPSLIWAATTGSNGVAAGNTMEEAVVQAFSEIEERYRQSRILAEHPALPVIPDEALQSFEYAYRIITFLRENGIRVFIKDCTQGGQFPVVCACFIDTRTGKYHSHFGAAPVLKIAVERALTETFQGRNLEEFAKYEEFRHSKDSDTLIEGLYRAFRVGEAVRPSEFFIKEAESPWNAQMGFTGKNNREILREIVRYYADRGYDMLVRDFSCFGFPTCRVLIPGYSESLLFNLSPKHNIYRFNSYATKAVRNPSHAGLENYLGLLQHLQEKETSLSVDDSRVIRGLRLALDVDYGEDTYILSATLGYFAYMLKKYKDTLTCVSKMVKNAPPKELERLICLKRYLTMVSNGTDAAQIKETLEFFHKPETVRQLYSAVEKKENLFEPYTLHCGTSACETCYMHKKCGHNQTGRLHAIRTTRQSKLDFDAFTAYLQKCMDV